MEKKHGICTITAKSIRKAWSLHYYCKPWRKTMGNELLLIFENAWEKEDLLSSIMPNLSLSMRSHWSMSMLLLLGSMRILRAPYLKNFPL
jgi:hypothetical protein